MNRSAVLLVLKFYNFTRDESRGEELLDKIQRGQKLKMLSLLFTKGLSSIELRKTFSETELCPPRFPAVFNNVFKSVIHKPKTMVNLTAIFQVHRANA